MRVRAIHTFEGKAAFLADRFLSSGRTASCSVVHRMLPAFLITLQSCKVPAIPNITSAHEQISGAPYCGLEVATLVERREFLAECQTGSFVDSSMDLDMHMIS
jgi:hypothetical protein